MDYQQVSKLSFNIQELHYPCHKMRIPRWVQSPLNLSLLILKFIKKILIFKYNYNYSKNMPENAL